MLRQHTSRVLDVNGDLSRRVLVHAAQLGWVPTAERGVTERLLDDVSCVWSTRLVSWRPGSIRTVIPGDGKAPVEELFVLEGALMFSDPSDAASEAHTAGGGAITAGTHLRGELRSLRSETGCIALVKRWWRAVEDSALVDSHQLHWSTTGLPTLVLTSGAGDRLSIERWPTGQMLPACAEGLELLVLRGSLELAGELLAPQSWLRWPRTRALEIKVARGGATLLVRRGHLWGVSGAKIP